MLREFFIHKENNLVLKFLLLFENFHYTIKKNLSWEQTFTCINKMGVVGLLGILWWFKGELGGVAWIFFCGWCQQ